jgi:PAS domain S-box-containing protein
MTRQPEGPSADDSTPKLFCEAERVAGIGSWIWDPDGDALTWSPNLYRLFGFEPHSVEPTFDLFYRHVHPDDVERLRAEWASATATGLTPPVEYRVVRPDGVTRHMLARGQVVRDEGHEIVRLVGTLTDVTERVANRAELRRVQQMLESAQEIANIGSWSWDPVDGEIRWTDHLYRITGIAPGEPLTIASFDNLVHVDDRPLLQAARQRTLEGADLGKGMVVRIVRPDGVVRWVEMAGRRHPDGSFDGVIMDVTDRRRLEDQLRAATTLEATGRLAAGIAHDFNNLLTVILANTSAVLADVERDELVEIQRSARSGASLVRRLLAFGRDREQQPRIIDLSLLVEDGANWIQRVIGDDVTVRAEVEAGLHVHADPSEIHRIMLNLALNGRDAMPDGGTLRVCLSSQDGQADITISDNGVGMDEETLALALEPFFTTKAAGRGTGLGLSTVYGAVRQLAGHMTITSEPGEGTRVQLTIPLVDAPTAPATEGEPSHIEATTSLRILLVEDDPGVRRSIARQLRGQQHHIFEAADANEAVHHLATEQLDLVVTDWSLPAGGGARVLAEINEKSPSLPVLVITGYLQDAVPPEVALLLKPFEPSELMQRIAALTSPH